MPDAQLELVSRTPAAHRPERMRPAGTTKPATGTRREPMTDLRIVVRIVRGAQGARPADNGDRRPCADGNQPGKARKMRGRAAGERGGGDLDAPRAATAPPPGSGPGPPPHGGIAAVTVASQSIPGARARPLQPRGSSPGRPVARPPHRPGRPCRTRRGPGGSNAVPPGGERVPGCPRPPGPAPTGSSHATSGRCGANCGTRHVRSRNIDRRNKPLLFCDLHHSPRNAGLGGSLLSVDESRGLRPGVSL
jgi:hypothetical protein